MAKAEVQDILDLGFDAAQFGDPVDWSAAEGGYLQRVLDTVEQYVRNRIGAQYDDIGPSDATRLAMLRSGETRLAEAELWRRIETHERASRTIGRADGGTETIGSRALSNAAQAESAGWALIGNAVGADYDHAGPAVGRIETGPWPVARA